MTTVGQTALKELEERLERAFDLLEQRKTTEWTWIDEASSAILDAILLAQTEIATAVEIASQPVNHPCPKCDEWDRWERAVFESSYDECKFCPYRTEGGDDYSVRCSNCGACFGCGNGSSHDRVKDRILKTPWPYLLFTKTENSDGELASEEAALQ